MPGPKELYSNRLDVLICLEQKCSDFQTPHTLNPPRTYVVAQSSKVISLVS